MTSLDFEALLRFEKKRYALQSKGSHAKTVFDIMTKIKQEKYHVTVNTAKKHDPIKDYDYNSSPLSFEFNHTANNVSIEECSNCVDHISKYQLMISEHINGRNSACDTTSSISELDQCCYYVPNFLSANDSKLIMSHIYSNVPDTSDWVTLNSRRLLCYGGIPPSSRDMEKRSLAKRFADEELNAKSAVHSNSKSQSVFPHWLQDLLTNVNENKLLNRMYKKKRLAYPVSTLDAIEAANNTSTLGLDHILINEYQPGQGIFHHTDGPLYEDFVCIVSMESSVLLTFRKKLDTSEIGMAKVYENSLEFKSVSNASSVSTATEETGNEMKEIDDLFSVLLEPNSLFVFSGSVYKNYLHGIQSFDTEGCGTIEEEITSFCPCINAHLCGAGSVIKGCANKANPVNVAVGDHIVRGHRVSLTIRRKLF